MLKQRAFFQFAAIIAVICLYLPVLQADDTAPIDINAASAEELMQLKGVGPKKAAAIIKFRETNGPFQVPEDLIKVPGIGPKTYEANKARIIIKAD